MKLSLLIALWFSIFASLQARELSIANLFTNHMVLQREQPVPVWGWAKPGEEVIVEFAGQKTASKADNQGKWLVRLDPMPAEMKGRELLVRTADEDRTLTLNDVVVGDVWLCSGQSNMHFTMKNVHGASTEIPAANHPALRFFYVNPQFAQQPKNHVQGQWMPVTPETVSQCSAVAYFFGRDLQQKLGVPIGLLLSSVGGTRIETWMQTETLSKLGVAAPLIEKWSGVSAAEFSEIVAANDEYQRQRWQVYPELVRSAKSAGTPVPAVPKPPAIRAHQCPSALHNGMIAPLQPFAIRGALWYQGEGNVGNPRDYEKMLPAMIADWREVWGKELPFLFVQLPPHETLTPQFREAQFRIWQSTPFTAMVVTTDVGDAKDLHPVRKRPIGERLALAARAMSYGEKVESSGPVFQSINIDGHRAVLTFAHAESGLMAKGDTLKGFTIAGKDGRHVPAIAEIQNSTVVVTSDEIQDPVAVRYGWEKVPIVNLVNQEGLPAVPFRTDVADVTSATDTTNP